MYRNGRYSVWHNIWIGFCCSLLCFDYINGVGAHKLLILSYHSLLIVRKPRSKLYFIAKYFIWRKMRQSPSGFVFKWRVRTLTLWKHVLFPSHQILWFNFSRPILFIVSACYPSIQFYCQWSNVVCCRIWINISQESDRFTRYNYSETSITMRCAYFVGCTVFPVAWWRHQMETFSA